MRRAFCCGVLTLLVGLAASSAQAVPVTFTKLTGLTGGTLAGTAVYKADLSSLALASVLSITIADSNSGTGGASGQFSGFDLDAILLSTTDCADAACAQAASGFSVFDFTGPGTIFTPGTQRPPADAKLYGTDGSGLAVDNSMATLGLFDAESTTATPFGFLSLGDGGSIAFNLTSAVSTTGLFLYVGEVGDNGEVAAGTVTVSDSPVVPEPATVLLLGAGLGLLGLRRTTRRS